jgi:hypothetical protein
MLSANSKSANSKTHTLAVAEPEFTSVCESRALTSLAEVCLYDRDDASISTLADERWDWPDTDAEEEGEIVKSLELKKSGHMENMLMALQNGHVALSSMLLLLCGKVACFAMNKVGCKVLELIVPRLEEAQLASVTRELKDNVASLSGHCYGSRVLRAVLKAQLRQPSLSSTIKLFTSEILIDFDDIILNPYACGVLTDLLVLGDEEVRSALGTALLNHNNSLFILCLQEFSCHVIAAAIRHCPKRYVFEMAREVLSKKTFILTRRPEGIVVLRALLKDAELSQKVKARLETRPDMLVTSRSGRRLMTDFAIRSCSTATRAA